MELNQLLKKAKWRQRLSTVAIVMICLVIVLPLCYWGFNKLSARNSDCLNETLFRYHLITEPNVQIDSQVLTNTSPFGGELITNRSKNIAGYIVPWSNLRSSYNFVGSSVDFNELTAGWYQSKSNSYEYDRQTKQKSATFYHPQNKKYYDGVKNELPELVQLKNEVAEVAISFDQPYSYKEVKKLIPENLTIAWLYMFSEQKDESVGPSALPKYGVQLSSNNKRDSEDENELFSEFLENMTAYNEENQTKEIKAFLEANEGKQLDEAKVLGVMLTGKTEDFAALLNKSFVRGASVGVTTATIPYIQPE